MKIGDIPIEPGTKFGIKYDPNTIYIINGSQRICIFRNMEISDPIDMTLPFLQRDDFEVIPPEPKVLTTDEILRKFDHASLVSYCIIDIINISDKNGQLKRDLEYKKYMNLACKKFGVVSVESVINYINDNIKPL